MFKKSLYYLIILTFFLVPVISKAFYTVEDEYYNYQKDYLKQINYSVGDPHHTPEGEGVVVAVIDSGVFMSHPDLQGSFWVNTDEIMNNGIDDDNNGYVDDVYGYNFMDNNHDMTTKNSHGTAVASIISANRDKIGILGIAPDATIMPLIVCSDNGCPLTAIQSAIKYAADNGADIINLSLGSVNGYVGYSHSYDSYIEYAFNKGVVIVASAGNGSTEGNVGLNLNDFPVSPVCNDDERNMIIGVGAVGVNWDNYGSNCVDVYAPGEDIVAALVEAHDDMAWGSGAGTSFSAPMVAATAARIKSEKPSLKNWEITSIILNNLQSAGILSVEDTYSKEQQDLDIIGIDKSSYNSGQKIKLSANYLSNDIKVKFVSDVDSYEAEEIDINGPTEAYIKINSAIPNGEYKLQVSAFYMGDYSWNSKTFEITGSSMHSNSSADGNSEESGQVSDISTDVTLVKLKGVEGSAVYYISGGKKYIFPDGKTYFTWYNNFDNVKEIDTSQLDEYEDGGIVTYRPGIKLVTHTNTAKVYAVSPGGILHRIPSEEVAIELYGDNWATLVQDVLPGYFTSYTLGDELEDRLPDGSFVKSGSDYYYIEDGKKCLFDSYSSAQDNGLTASNFIEVDDTSKYPSGEIIDRKVDRISKMQY